MKATVSMIGLLLACASLIASPVSSGAAEETAATEKPAPQGVVEREALGKVAFLVGDWQGEGWAVTRAGERLRFWVKEFYKYRGDKDLLDMEGRFGNMLADGTRTAETEYDLGILYYDRESHEYRMWHYSSTGEVFTVTMQVDLDKREASYTKEYPGGITGKFHLVVGTDGVWISRFDILQPDQSWRQVMEFRMERVGR